MIQDVDETLRKMLLAELARMPGRPLHDSTQITFASPDDGASASAPRLNLYFYEVQEDRSLRDDSFQRISHDADGSQVGRRRAAIRLSLSYLLTAEGGGDSHLEHRLLSEAMGALMRYDAIPALYLSGSLAGLDSNTVRLTVAQPDHLIHANPSGLWQALGGKLRPALGLTINVPFNPFETQWTRVVREVVMGVGQGVPPNGPRRPLDLSGVRVSLAGAITDQDQKSPLAGVHVSLEGHDLQAMSDDRGVFYFLNLPAGPYTLVFHKRGLAESRFQAIAPPPGRAELLEPLVVTMTALPADAQVSEEIAHLASFRPRAEIRETNRSVRVSLSGKLTYPDGSPAAYIPVSAGGQRAITDAAGIYSFIHLPPGDHTVSVDVPGVNYVQATESARREEAAASSPAITQAALVSPSPPSSSLVPTRAKKRVP